MLALWTIGVNHAYNKSTSRSKDPRCFAERLNRVLQEAKDRDHQDTIERDVNKWKSFGIALDNCYPSGLGDLGQSRLHCHFDSQRAGKSPCPHPDFQSPAFRRHKSLNS